MAYLSIIPNSHPSRNAMLREIAKRLEDEADRLKAFAVEVNARDSLSVGDNTILTAQLTATNAKLTAITTEISDAHSLVNTDSAPFSAWVGTVAIAGGIDRLSVG